MAMGRAAPGSPPMYRQIAAALQERIDDGVWGPGQKLPSEAALVGEFKVNRLTVRQALDDLSRAGSVRIEHGRGAFVVDRAVKVEIEVDGSTQLQVGWRHAADTESIYERLVGHGPGLGAPPELSYLRLEPKQATRVDTIAEVNGRPQVFSSYWLDRRRFPRLAARWQTERSVVDVLRSYGVEVTYDWRGFRAAAANFVQAEHLDVAVGSPLLVRDGVSVDQNGVPAYYVMRWVPGDRIKYILRYRES